jgi:hypothetical protein
MKTPSDSGCRQASWSNPQEQPAQTCESDGSPVWVVRGDQFVIALTRGSAGTCLLRNGEEREYIVVLPPGVDACVSAGSEKMDIRGDSLTVVPPGNSAVTLKTPGMVARIFTEHARDLLGVAANAHLYVTQAVQAPPDWHAALDMPRLRHYPLASFAQRTGPLIRPRVFRSADLMVNAFEPFDAPRPTAALRPHAHAAFDQASIALRGPWIHHLRTPWGSDMSGWHDDQHIELPSPSVVVIPATMVHTSRNTEPDGWLLDVFGSPRVDFLRSGIVLNAGEYAMPPAETTAGSEHVPNAWLRTA